MKKGNVIVLLALFSVLSAVFFWGCGGNDPGSPGSSGSSDTGIAVSVLLVTHSDPARDQGQNWQVDLAADQCTATTVEKWGDDIAHVTFHAEALNPNVTSTNELFVTNYTVTFLKTDPSLPTIEQISGSSQAGITVLPGQDSGPFDFLVVDFGRKLKIQSDLSSGVYNVSTPLLYNMIINIYGQDKFGNNVTFPPIERLIEIADYNNC